MPSVPTVFLTDSGEAKDGYPHTDGCNQYNHSKNKKISVTVR